MTTERIDALVDCKNAAHLLAIGPTLDEIAALIARLRAAETRADEAVEGLREIVGVSSPQFAAGQIARRVLSREEQTTCLVCGGEGTTECNLAEHDFEDTCGACGGSGSTVRDTGIET